MVLDRLDGTFDLGVIDHDLDLQLGYVGDGVLRAAIDLLVAALAAMAVLAKSLALRLTGGETSRRGEILARTLEFTAACLVLVLGLALLLNRPFRGQKLVQTVLMVPLMVAPVIAAILCLVTA